MKRQQVSLFSLLLPSLARAASYKRCPIKGLSAKSRLNYEDFPGRCSFLPAPVGSAESQFSD